MDITPQIFTAKVMHKRFLPQENSFMYGVYYLVLPLPAPAIASLLMRFDAKDLGYRNGSDPSTFASAILATYGVKHKIQNITLITMPRVLGYVFNPVSFYFCFNAEEQLIAVIAEVHNTFGEQHTYLCMHTNHAPIEAEDWLEADKLFHVSPFLEREGHYRFRFALKNNKLGIWVDYINKDNNKQLITSLIGRLTPLNKASLRKAFWSHPLVTLKTIFFIHWQALKLISKRIRYVAKPEQYEKNVSTTAKSDD